MAEWKELQLKEDKYTDAEAVAAVAASDDYVKNTGDSMTGLLNVTSEDGLQTKRLYVYANTDGKIRQQFILADYTTVIGSLQGDTNGLTYFIKDSGGSWREMLVLERASPYDIDFSSRRIKNPKNHAASALSGTKKLVEINIGGASYYFEVYPTKA